MNKQVEMPEQRLTPRPVREEQAWQEIGQTEFAPGLRNALIVGFLAIIVLVPLVQLTMSAGMYAHLAGETEQDAAVAEGTWTTATLVAISDPPDTSGVYNDFLMQLHVTDCEPAHDGDVLVVAYGMRQRVVQDVAGLRPGSQVRLQLQSWDSVASQVEGINASQLSDGKYVHMQRVFAVAVESEDAGGGARGFLANWSGIGADLPPEHRTGLGDGMSTAWNSEADLLSAFLAGNGHLRKRISLYETALDDSAWLSLFLRSPVQGLMSEMGVGNEKALMGHDGWLFYSPGVKSLTGAGFLEPQVLFKRGRTEAVAADPRPAIIAFHEQLAARGIELILMPTPVKPSVYPEMLSRRYEAGDAPLRNASMEQFLQEIQQAGVRVYDPMACLITSKEQQLTYVPTDTHWTPLGMQAVAQELVGQLDLPKGEAGLTVSATPVQQFGDIATMLELPAWQGVVDEDALQIEAVRDAKGQGWQADAKAEVLILGDSFSNIYHLGPMGWGEYGGFAEHVSYQLQRPVDLLARNDAGAHASRKMLLEALETNPHRLSNKKYVIWQFAERELALGDWQILDLPEAPAAVEDVPADDQPGITVADAAAAPKAYAQLLAAAGDKPVVQAKDGWLHLREEFRCLSSERFWGDAADKQRGDPKATLVNFKDALAELGIELLLVPVPPRAVVYADTLFDAVPKTADGQLQRLDPGLQAFYAELREAGVQVIDPTDAFLQARLDEDQAGLLCCEQDSHWSPRGLQLAASLVYEAIAGDEEPDWMVEWVDESEADMFDHDPQALEYTGDLVGRVDGLGESISKTTILRVTDDEAGKKTLSFDSNSPVVLLADSHGLVFSTGEDMHSTGAGFGEMLSLECGFPLDRMARRGSGDSVRVDMARRFLTQPQDVDGKRVVIYSFAARTFTAGRSWKPVPLKR